MRAFGFVVFFLMPAIGLLFSLRIWLFLRNGLRVTVEVLSISVLTLPFAGQRK